MLLWGSLPPSANACVAGGGTNTRSHSRYLELIFLAATPWTQLQYKGWCLLQGESPARTSKSWPLKKKGEEYKLTRKETRLQLFHICGHPLQVSGPSHRKCRLPNALLLLLLILRSHTCWHIQMHPCMAPLAGSLVVHQTSEKTKRRGYFLYVSN